jgi:hypothetical protein
MAYRHKWWLESRQEEEVFCVLENVQWGVGALYPMKSREALDLHVMPRLRIPGATPPLLMLSRRGT